MLKAVVKQMHDGVLGNNRCGLCQKSGLVALGSYVDRNICLPRNQERLVTEFPGGSLRSNTGGQPALSAVTSGKDIYLETAIRQRLGQRDCKRSFAGAARREVTYADY